jgi:DNA primase
VLFNLHRVLEGIEAGGWGDHANHVVLVEGFFSVFRLHFLGIPAVALMGRSLSEEQTRLLAQAGIGLVTVLMDGDAPGRKAAEEILPVLARQCFVRDAVLPDGAQPDTVDGEELRSLVAPATFLRASI